MWRRHLCTPLRYPGGKSRAISTILPHLPKAEPKLCSPFFGGGAIELSCAAKGCRIKGYDSFQPLVTFWRQIIHHPAKVAQQVMRYYPLKPEDFYRLQKEYARLCDPLEQAAVFFVLNRASFSGTTLSGGMSPGHPRFTLTAIERLRQFKPYRLSVEAKDFRESIPENPTDFLYLDPPYMNNQRLYGRQGDTHLGFDHHALAELLKQRGRWLLSYNDCAGVRTLYKGFQIIPLYWRYGMNKSKKSNELLIFSQDVPVSAPLN